MKYIKMVWFDIRRGILRNPILFVVPVIVAFIACCDLNNRIVAQNEWIAYESNSCETQIKGGFADYMMYIYGGMDKYVPESGNYFIFPIRWMVVFLMISFITLSYPYKDMQGFGRQILIRTRGRTIWWLSKCIWNIFSVLIYHSVIFGIAALFGIAVGSGITGKINKDLQYEVFQIAGDSLLSDDMSWPFVIILLPVLISLSINLLQMTLSLFIKPIFSFLIAAFLMISSAYFTSPYLIGNYAMSMRYDMVIEDGVSVTAGLVVAFVLMILSVGTGMIRFRRYDICNED
ncbi:MAG: hypothetical protein HFI34_05790 [Lachnospiraceae bacterium]|nr:hypothetical protein [Lachnospiraceae bacterium]